MNYWRCEKTMQDVAVMTTTSHADDSTEKTQPDFPCGKCDLECLWFHWQCVNLAGK